MDVKLRAPGNGQWRHSWICSLLEAWKKNKQNCVSSKVIIFNSKKYIHVLESNPVYCLFSDRQFWKYISHNITRSLWFGQKVYKFSDIFVQEKGDRRLCVYHKLTFRELVSDNYIIMLSNNYSNIFLFAEIIETRWKIGMSCQQLINNA